ncbi:SGNH/GDSL hydrolase family protein [Gemmatimonadota bacterium]
MNVVFFGDSICVGQYVSPHLIWISKIASRLNEAFPAGGILVVNSSINGDTTRMALERVAVDVQRYNPEVLVVQFGINDSNFWDTDNGVPRVQKRAFEANLHEIFARGRNFGAKKIILNTNHPTNKPLPLQNINHSVGNAAYNDLIRRVAADDGQVKLIDIERVFQQRIEAGTELDELLLPDGIHLSLSGHQLYYDTVCPVMEHSLGELGAN